MQPKKPNDAITLLCSPQSLFACHISTYTNNRLHIHQAIKISLNYLELEQLVIFNPTRIAQHINTVRQQFNLLNAPLLVGLYGPAIKDECIHLPSCNPTMKQMPISHAPHWEWDYSYLYPHDHLFCFYVCGIPRELIFQFKLMAIAHEWNLYYLTSERMALLQLYRHLFGSAFRPSQLGLHMQLRNNNIDALLSRDDLARIAQFSDEINNETGLLLSSCGLFVGGTSHA